MKKNQDGFHVIELTVVLIVVAVVGFGGWRVVSKHKNQQKSSGSVASQNSGTVQLTHEPMDMRDVSTILPAGTLAGAHVTPIDHLYFYPNDMTNRDAAPVYAMADGYIVSYSVRTQKVDNGAAQKAEYQLYFQHSCSFYTYFDLLTSLEPGLAKQIDASGGKDLHIPVKSGQQIGRVGAQSLDTAVYNFDLTLKGFVNPDSYKTELYKLHTDDFFKYFKNPALDEMLAKDQRKFTPYGGKIDYDIDGKLVGNWFQTGTNGYAGAGQRVADSNGQGYWNSHLAVVPDAVTRNQIDISIGDYQGKATQFTAKAGSPDPATIGKSSGLTKYEFTQYVLPSSPTGGVSAQNTQVVGTVLFQLTDTRKLKMEAFPGQTATQVNGFTGNAKTYER
ncbi:MAG TPA: hypothetical protein VGO07_01850 [Candidatus Saccharimonadales bacterium]|jgi:hypothetical protein|nr:hypothetical protein [Candidatus Saccharimonadales bacterium]